MSNTSFIPLSFMTLSFIPLASLVIATGFLIGCGGGQERRAETAKTSAAVSVDVTKAKQDLDGTLSELKNLRDASDTADLKKMQSDLKTKSSLLRNSLSDAVITSETAVIAGKTQNDEWHKQADAFTDADLRNSSQKRQSDLRGSIDELATASATLKNESDTYLSQLNQVISALDLDLTQQGVHAINPTLVKLIENEPKLRQCLSDVAAKGKAVNTVINP
jgi:molecular chaperone GrpE (heat shock protein)